MLQFFNHEKKAAEPRLEIVHAYTFIAVVYCALFSLVFYAETKNAFLIALHITALVAVISNYLVLRKTRNFKRAAHVILGTGSVIIVSLFATGGWQNTGHLWFFGYLPFAFFLSHRKVIHEWVVLPLIGCLLITLLHFLNIVTLPYSSVVLINYFAALGIFILCIAIFQKATIQHQQSFAGKYADGILRSEQRFRTLVENSHEIISLVDENSRFIYRSPSAERITGWTNDEKLPIGVDNDQVHPDDLEKTNLIMQEVLANPGKPIPVCFRTRHKAGHYIWLEGLMTNMFHDENIKAILSNLRDITGRKKSDEQQAFFASVINSSDDAILTKSIDGVYTSWNYGAVKMFGYPSEEIIGQSISQLTHPEMFKEDIEIIERIKRNEKIEHYETKRTRKDGKNVHVSLSVSPIIDKEGNIIGASKIIRDITKRKEAEEEIYKLTEELRILLEHVQTSREEERKYIAREIHDELGQALTALKIDVSMMKRKMIAETTHCPVYIDSELTSIIGKIDSSIESVKRIATDLRPEILDHLDIVEAIKWQAQQFEKITGIQCSISQLPDHLDLENSFSTTVYRTIQEALTNITRHSNATVVRILVERNSKKLLVEINDNGKGIKEEDIKNIKSLGLIGMRERVLLLNGTLSISGKPSMGTTIAVELPLD
jgi:PAS domain S-box-containing protein